MQTKTIVTYDKGKIATTNNKEKRKRKTKPHIIFAPYLAHAKLNSGTAVNRIRKKRKGCAK